MQASNPQTKFDFMKQLEEEDETLTRVTIEMSHEHLVQAVSWYLQAYKLLPFNSSVVIVDADFGIDLNANGLVEFDILVEEEKAN